MSGYFGQPYVGIPCKACETQPYLKCEQNSTFPSISAGYYRNPDNPNLVYECISKDACLSTSSDVLFTKCVNGYTGWLCGSCIPFEYYKIGSACIECPSIVSKSLTLSFIAIIFCIVLWKFSTIKTFSGIVDLKILLFWVQIIALFPQLSSTWPKELAIFFQYVSFVNLDLEISSPAKHFLLSKAIANVFKNAQSSLITGKNTTQSFLCHLFFLQHTCFNGYINLVAQKFKLRFRISRKSLSSFLSSLFLFCSLSYFPHCCPHLIVFHNLTELIFCGATPRSNAFGRMA
jgi:hypothetical protein